MPQLVCPPEAVYLKCPPCTSQTHGDGVTAEGLSPLWALCHFCLSYKVTRPAVHNLEVQEEGNNSTIQRWRC